MESESLVHRHSCFECAQVRHVRCENAVALTLREVWQSDFASGLSCVSCECTKFPMYTRTSVQRRNCISVFLGPYHRNVVMRPGKLCCGLFLLTKPVWIKFTSLVGALCKTICVLSTICKVCVMLCCMVCEISQGSCLDHSPWDYLWDPRPGSQYSSWR